MIAAPAQAATDCQTKLMYAGSATIKKKIRFHAYHRVTMCVDGKKITWGTFTPEYRIDDRNRRVNVDRVSSRGWTWYWGGGTYNTQAEFKFWYVKSRNGGLTKGRPDIYSQLRVAPNWAKRRSIGSYRA